MPIGLASSSTPRTFGGEILELCVAVGGTITGEHGVGHARRSIRCACSSAADELSQFHAVKAAFDPGGLLNPGKAVPTLHRCAEFGAHARPSRHSCPSPSWNASDGCDEGRRPVSEELLAAGARRTRTRGTPLQHRRRRQQGLSTGEPVAGDAARCRAATAVSSNYDPRELVVTVRARYAARRARGSAGSKPKARCWPSSRRTSAATRPSAGMIAAGLSGPRRPWCRRRSATSSSAAS